MATLMATFATLSPVLSAIGTAVSVLSSLSQASKQKAAAAEQQRIATFNRTLAERQAESLEQQAGQTRASAQRAVIEQQRQGKFVTSRALAVAGASGAGALDPTIINILGDIEFESDFRAGVAGFEGEEAAAGLDFEAVLARARGEAGLAAGTAAAGATAAAGRRSLLRAGATAFTGGSSLFDRFATSPPPGSQSFNLNQPPRPGQLRFG